MPAIVPTSTNHIIDLTLEEGEMRRLDAEVTSNNKRPRRTTWYTT